MKDKLEAKYGPIWISGGDFYPLATMGDRHLTNLHLKLKGTVSKMNNCVQAAKLFRREKAEYDGTQIEIVQLEESILGLDYWIAKTQEELDKRGVTLNRDPSSAYTLEELAERLEA